MECTPGAGNKWLGERKTEVAGGRSACSRDRRETDHVLVGVVRVGRILLFARSDFLRLESGNSRGAFFWQSINMILLVIFFFLIHE